MNIIFVPVFLLNALILQFDGSLRYPWDPGYPTSSLGKMAACAACLILEPRDNLFELESVYLSEGREIILLGGKTFSVDSQVKSSEIEYEGLAFGLRKLNDFVISNEHLKSPTNLEKLTILVQGDCKTVMSQMNNRARSRKLEQNNQLCINLIALMPSFLEFEFQHIPREENIICDRLANRLIVDQQQNALDSFCRDLDMYVLQNYQELNEDFGSYRSTNLAPDIISRHFGASKRSLIPLSLRPKLYFLVVHLLSTIGNFHSILKIGEFYQREVESEWSSAVKISSLQSTFKQCTDVDGSIISPTKFNSDLLLAEALSYQVLALRALNRTKEADSIYRRKKVIIELCFSTVQSSLMSRSLDTSSVMLTLRNKLFAGEEFGLKLNLPNSPIAAEWINSKLQAYPKLLLDDNNEVLFKVQKERQDNVK